MLSDVQRLLNKALTLPENDRRRVAEILLNSISDTNQIEDAWNSESISRTNAAVHDQISRLDGPSEIDKLEQNLRRLNH